MDRISLGKLVGEMKNFTIDNTKSFDIVIREIHSSLENPENPTDNDLIKILKGYQPSIMIASDDSQEFKTLRNQLETEGYIKCERSWSNGDRVLKAFSLNGLKFHKGEKFFCGAAMKYYLNRQEELNGKN